MFVSRVTRRNVPAPASSGTTRKTGQRPDTATRSRLGLAECRRRPKQTGGRADGAGGLLDGVVLLSEASWLAEHRRVVGPETSLGEGYEEQVGKRSDGLVGELRGMAGDGAGDK